MARPVYVLEVGFASSPDEPIASTQWTDITPYLNVRERVKITRGRADEQSDVQPSKLSLVLKNTDGRFTAGRSASPYFPNVRIGKRIRLGLMWPGDGRQLVANPSFATTAAGWTGGGSVPPTVVRSTAQALDGPASLLVTWGTAGSFPSAGVVVQGLAVGTQYTASASVWVPVGSPGVAVVVAGTIGVGSSTTGAWQRISVTFTATANSQRLELWPTAAPTAGQQVYIDAVQMEAGTVASTFTATPGVFSWRFTGDVNEWPTEWAGGVAGYSETNLSATDRLKRTGDIGEYAGTLEEDILDDSPWAYYPMQEPALSASAGDISGRDETVLTVVQVGNSGGDLRFKQDVDNANSAGGYFASDATTVGFNPDPTNTLGKYLRATFRKPIPASSAVGAGVTVTAWAREGAVPPPTGPVVILNAADGSWFGVSKVANGNITAVFYNAYSGTVTNVVSGFGLGTLRGDFYQAILDIPSAGNLRLTFRINGGTVGTPVTFLFPRIPEWVSGSVGGTGKALFRGNISHAAFYNYRVLDVALNGQFQAGRNGLDGAGNTSLGRLNKLCIYSGLGTLQSYNPTPAAAWAPVGAQQIQGNPLAAMRIIEATENGMFYLTGDGLPMFANRASRYNQAAGFTVNASRLDPGALQFRGDDYGLVNDVTGSQPGGASVRLVSQTSVDTYGRRKGTLDAVPAFDAQLRALSAWTANTLGEMRNRITGVRISLLNDPSLIATALTAVFPGSKMALTLLPTQAPTSFVTLFVEGWEEVISEEEWTMTFNTSPGEVGDVWQIGTAGKSEIGTTTRIAY